MGKHKNDFTGTGKVYAFTLSQFFKGKANLITLAVLFVISLFSVPVISFVQGGASSESSLELSTVFVVNETGLPIDPTEIDAPEVLETDAIPEELAENQAAVRYWLDEAGYHVSVQCSQTESGEIVAQQAKKALEQARYESLGAAPEQLAVLTSGYETHVNTVAGYLDSTKLDFADAFAIQYVYAILVMILSLFSSTYIVRAVIEEKSSKLVETLMVSVRPLALILGKILAVMTYIFGVLVMMVLAVVISYLVSGMFLSIQSPLTMLANMGLDLSEMHVGIGTIFIIAVSLLLGYFTFAILGGIFGTACSSMEDMESANLSVVLVVMAGYLVSCFTVGIGSRVVGLAVSLVPIASIFCAPVQYVCGTISFGMLCVAWFVQLLVLGLLAWFSAKIYHDLLLYRGRKMKLSQMLKLARQQKGGAAE